MPLQRITLRDFVIVEALELDWRGAFTVLTGETGAGKSILIDALQLALGARADAAVVREGCALADICAEFDNAAHLAPWLQEAGFDPQEPSLLLRRSIDAQGRSRAWINGTPCTAAQLRALGGQLVEIHGQHAWQSLTRPDAARRLLDAWAGVDDTPVQALWQRWSQAQQTLAQAQTSQENIQQERERLQWQIAEVEPLAPESGEWDELNAQHTRLSNAQALLDAVQSALHLLAGDDSPGAASVALGRASHVLQAQAGIAPELAELADTLDACQAQVEDVCHSLQSWLRHTDLDPEHLAELDARLSLWLQLARRYRRQPQDLPALLHDWRAHLQQLDSTADLAQLQAQAQHARQQYQAQADQLAQQRAQAAPRLAQAVTTAMQSLGMPGGVFDVLITPLQAPGPHGTDSVAFLVAGHPGVAPRPIAKVASGGELSRLALAIAVCTSAQGEAGTLIFDEVDTGIGGAVAETVGRLMHQLGRTRQVLAVTHLPQVAVWADHHCQVRKHGARCTVQRLSTLDARSAEVARMLGGQHLSATTLAHAREMLDAARQPEISV